MRKTTKSLAFFLLFSSIILPLLPITTVAQAETRVFRRATSSLVGDWDPSITDWYSVIAEQYLWQICEVPFGSPAWFSAGVNAPVEDEFIGILATNLVLEKRPDENNTLGFTNTGGYKSATITLREGVKFSDGSDWNATAYKWNIDRNYLINGNFTGAAVDGGGAGQDRWEEDEGNNMGTIIVDDMKPYFTASWNMSEFDAPLLLSAPTTPPTVTDYAYYDLGPNRSLVEYPGVNILSNGTVRNPTPYTGWDSGVGAAIHAAPYDRYSQVKYVEILESKQSGGTVKIHYNTWSSGGIGAFAVNGPQLSYHSYKDDYTIHGIYGYENDVQTAPNPSLIDHLIGTGAYIYVEHDETGTPPGGHMIKNENYWNKTDLEAGGYFDADRIEIVKFPAGELGKDAQNTALLTHAIDYSYDSMFQPLDYNAIQANPNIRYEDAAASEYKTNIVLNAINETWWAWPARDEWRKGEYGDLSGNFSAGGVPLAMRKAMSYAFNYDLMIHTVLNDRAVRNGGILGTANLYYNESVGIADYNLTYAREILLTTETDESGEVFKSNISGPAYLDYSPDPDLYNFSKMCADRGLSMADVADNPTNNAKWQNIADTNPIYLFNYYWDSAHQDATSVLITSLKDIGVALKDEVGITNKVTTIIWDTVRIGHLTTFDGDHSLFSCNGWIMDEHMPHDTPQTNTFWHYVDPDRGRWRTLGWGGITSQHYWGNYGFNFNAEVDLAFDRIATSAPLDKKQYYSTIARIQQEEKFGVIFLYEAKEGWAMWKDWTTFFVENREGYLSGLWGGITSHFLDYVGLTEDFPLIPGAPLMLTLIVTSVSALGIVYAIMRKKRLK